jgi:hypothetical protein
MDHTKPRRRREKGEGRRRRERKHRAHQSAAGVARAETPPRPTTLVNRLSLHCPVSSLHRLITMSLA